MDTALENELEAAALREGVTKSQFIISAVERALGRKDLHRSLLDIHVKYGIASSSAAVLAEEPPPPGDRDRKGAYRRALKEKHDQQMVDWLAYQDARKRGAVWSPQDDPSKGPAT